MSIRSDPLFRTDKLCPKEGVVSFSALQAAAGQRPGVLVHGL